MYSLSTAFGNAPLFVLGAYSGSRRLPEYAPNTKWANRRRRRQ